MLLSPLSIRLTLTAKRRRRRACELAERQVERRIVIEPQLKTNGSGRDFGLFDKPLPGFGDAVLIQKCRETLAEMFVQKLRKLVRAHRQERRGFGQIDLGVAVDFVVLKQRADAHRQRRDVDIRRQGASVLDAFDRWLQVEKRRGVPLQKDVCPDTRERCKRHRRLHPEKMVPYQPHRDDRQHHDVAEAEDQQIAHQPLRAE